MASSFPFRQIHLDFHNAPSIPDIGADWDADRFVATLKRAHVNSVTVFAKCHHGMCYYPTAVGTPHPALQFDLLGQQLDTLHGAGIRAPIYVSVMWDVAAAEQHPEWRVIDTEGRQVSTSGSPFRPGWPFLCVNTGYADQLVEQVTELIGRYDCDGFFLDILFYPHETCVCPACLADMRRAGRNPQNPAHRLAQTQEAARRFMARMSGVIRERLPDAGIFYNSRWGLQFAGERQYYSQIEIEALPTGGWGYGFYPLWSRHGRGFGLPMLGMTGRFHRSWADWGGLKHPDALRFECGGILATGGAISIGDQLHPRGQLSEAVYEVIGEAFGDVAAVESYCVGARGEAQIGLLVLDDPIDRTTVGGAGGAIEGAGKILLELHQQFDVITPESCADFSAYELLLVPDRGVASPDVRARLQTFVANGGKLLLSHEALLDPETRAFSLATEIGFDYVGPAASNPDYFQLDDPALHGPITRANFPYSLYLGPSSRVAPQPGTQILARAYESYFNRTWEHFSSHDFTAPRTEPADYPAITRHGDVVYLSGPIFAAYQRYGNVTFRALIGRCLALLLPNPFVATDAPATAEVALMRQNERQIIHIVNYHASRRAPSHVEVLEAPVPLRDVQVQVRRSEPTSRVFLAHSGAALSYTVTGDVVHVTVPRVDAHAMVVLEP
jgi:hypothetical protein